MVLSSVTVRPASDREEEFRRACRRDRLVVSTPIPRPASGSPHQFYITQGPPLPTPPPRHTADVGPAASDADRRVRAAAISARVRAETEEVIRPLRDLAASASAAPRQDLPPREENDHYDLAKWGRRYARWH